MLSRRRATWKLSRRRQATRKLSSKRPIPTWTRESRQSRRGLRSTPSGRRASRSDHQTSPSLPSGTETTSRGTSFGQASKSLFKISTTNVGPEELSSSVEGGTCESSSSGCHRGSSGTGTVVHRGWARPHIMSRSRLHPSARERHVRATRGRHHQHRFNCEAS